MCSEVYLTDVVITEYSVVSRVGSVVGCYMVQGASCRECDTRFQTFFWSQFSVVVLKFLADVDESSSWLDDPLSKASDLSLYFGCLAHVLEWFFEKELLCLELFCLDSRHLVFVDLIGSIALKLVVREFELDRGVPASEAAKDLVGLRGRIIVLDLALGLYLHLGLALTLLWLFSSFLFEYKVPRVKTE